MQLNVSLDLKAGVEPLPRADKPDGRPAVQRRVAVPPASLLEMQSLEPGTEGSMPRPEVTDAVLLEEHAVIAERGELTAEELAAAT